MFLDYQVEKFIDEIAIPRYIGTENNQKVQEIIKQRFNMIPGISLKEQRFTASHTFMSIILNIIHPIIGFLIGFLFGLVYFGYQQIAYYFTWPVLILIIFNRQLIRWLQPRTRTWGKQYEINNYYATIEPTKEVTQNIVYFAHYDSKSCSYGPLQEALIYFAGFIGASCFILHLLVYLTFNLYLNYPSGSIWQLSWGIFLALICFFGLFNKKGNDSPGYLDDAAGVGQLYHLAHIYGQNPLEHTRIVLVITGAEEIGDFGAQMFIEKNPLKLSPKNTQCIISDGYGTSSGNIIIPTIGWPKKHWSPILESITSKLIPEMDTPLKFFHIPPLLQVASDHIPLENAGFQFIWIAALTNFYHTKNDNKNQFNSVVYEKINDMLAKLAQKYDEYSKKE